MKAFHSRFAVGATLAFALSAGALSAQEQPARGNFDPQQFQQQMQQRMMEFFRERLVVTNDAEWKVVETRLSKVMQMRIESVFSGMGAFGGMGMGMGGRSRGGEGQAGGRAARLGSMFGQPSPEAEALQKAIEANAPAAELRARLEKLREARKKKAADLAKAQEDLRQVLSLRQEATLVTLSLLD